MATRGESEHGRSSGRGGQYRHGEGRPRRGRDGGDRPRGGGGRPRGGGGRPRGGGGWRGRERGPGGGKNEKRIVLLETTAALDSPVVLEQIPPGLSWKFASNAPRYWVKLKPTDRDAALTVQDAGREMYVADQHKTNLETLKRELNTLFRNSQEQSEYELWCEARFGRSVWRAETELHRNLCVEDVLGLQNRQFYVRTTTKTEDMIKSLCSVADEEPRDTVVLTVKDITAAGNDVKYKITIDKNANGLFDYDGEFHHYSDHLGRVTADFVCIGRSYDVRICSTCKYQVSSSSKPAQVMKDVRKIADSMHQDDNGKLKMILKCGCVEVTFVRQMKRWNITLEVGHHGVNFYEVKETNPELLDLVEGQLVELEHNDNQEIEVKVIRKVKKGHKIEEILQEVEELVEYAMMDVAKKAERWKDPDMPY